jgi:hypothetical protein
MRGNTSSTAVADTAAVTEDQAASTQLGTTLTLDATGVAAVENLQLRLSTLAHTSGGRVSYGEVTLDETGRPTCPVGFDCSSYDPPVDGQPNPEAVQDFSRLIEGVNADRCIFTGALIAR